MKITHPLSAAGAVALLLAAAGCGGRPDAWSQPASAPQVVPLASSVALIDTPANRVVSLSVRNAANDLAITRVPTGRDIVAADPAPDGSALFVLTAGHRAALGDPLPDELPRLLVIPDVGGGAAAPESIDLGLTDPLDGLAIDPEGKWAVVYAASKSGSALVTNPNDLVIVDLTSSPPRPHHHTLHSFGGRPDGLIFTPALPLAGGDSQLLVVRSQQQLALVVLNPAGISDTDEVTVFLADATATTSPAPEQVVVDAGGSGQDPQIGIRFTGDTSVMTLQLGAPASGGGAFKTSVNVSDVGGVPSDIAFVRTDGGLRLAALVPGGARAMLVDPATSITTEVDLPAPYERISLVTRDTGGGATDLALLWQGSRSTTAGVAFWELGQAAGRPFRSIETVGVSGSVSDVLDVPRKDLPLKVLATSGANTFYVLDLGTRTAAPLITSQPRVVLTVSPVGQRVWTFAPGGEALASTDLTGEQVRTLRADTPIDAVFEIARTGAGAGRAVIALHAAGAVGATVYDADTPDDTKRRIYGALLEEGPYADQ
jgi:hypothetical protein